ncbi:hypothetical protein BV20DRAFT_933432 [Pilatotrama ljubarskyi]|nr:hypothetical protein BV20DRAFT_933432 [Pilatotrama ljubarskyi]
MANRRETGERVGGRGGRSSNKENKLATQKGNDAQKASVQTANKSVHRSASMELPPPKPAMQQASPGPSRLREPEAPPSPGLSQGPSLQQELYGALNYCDPSEALDGLENWQQRWADGSFDSILSGSTPPQTPGLSPSKSSATKLNIPPESPYDPRRTPAFRHSPPRLPSDQPWRASSAAVNQAVRQLTLGMLVCGEASPNVRGLDVSPIVIVPASERKKRSIFSPPTIQTPERFTLLDMPSEQEPDMFFPSPRRLFADVDRPDSTPSIMSRMGDFAWPSPLKDFASSVHMGMGFSTPGGEVEDPFKAYLHLSPAPKVGESSPAHPPSSSGSSRSPASRTRPEGISAIPDFHASPTPVFGPARSTITSMSKLRWRVFPEGEGEGDGDVDMEPIEDASALPRKSGFASLGLGTPVRLPEHRRTESASSAEAGSSSGGAPSSGSGTSDKAPLSSGSSGSRRDSSPFRFGSHGRQRSSSSAGPSSSASGSSSSHKSSLGSVTTTGLMDKILGRQEKPQRRRTSHHAHDGEVAVDAMGSPFKLGRKTSRNEFLYSLDGDCEMQEAQPKKRRKTISGRD